MTSSTKHLDAVGTIEDLGSVENMPESQNPFGAGRQRQYNPFDPLVRQTYESGKPRLAVADNLSSARVLIRRAAEHAGYGIDIVQTTTTDGRAALAYLARDKRPKAPNNSRAAAPDSSAVPASSATPSPSAPAATTSAPAPSPPMPDPSPAFDDHDQAAVSSP